MEVYVYPLPCTNFSKFRVRLTQGTQTFDFAYEGKLGEANWYAAMVRKAILAADRERAESGVELAEKISESLGRTKQENARLRTENQALRGLSAARLKCANRYAEQYRRLRDDMARVLFANPNLPRAESQVNPDDYFSKGESKLGQD